MIDIKTGQSISFEEWSATAESEYTIDVGIRGDSCCRDIYTLPDGTKIYDHWMSPYNVLKPAYGFTVVDLVIPVSSALKTLLKQYDGEIDTNWYTPDGYGIPYFNGKGKEADWSCRTAFKFVEEQKEFLLKNFPIPENV